MSKSRYQVIQAERNGQPFFIVIDAALDPARDAPCFPWLLTVSLPIRDPDSSGLCDQPESERLDEVEDRLLDSLEDVEHRYVGHVTGNGRREVLVYVSDREEVKAKLKEAAALLGEPLEFTEECDPEWEFYSQFPL